MRCLKAGYNIELTSFLEKLNAIPEQLKTIFGNAIAFLVTACFGIGVVLAIVGAIQWATGWDDRGGKKTIVKGIVLIALSLALGGGVLAGYVYIDT
ncbi:MAG: hypothetical protein K9W42_02460 [Candidatus Heimdallarchaeota archaeon]|nr:hypothetical protein [Candidatus Heimdallarchaeota archaeon]